MNPASPSDTPPDVIDRVRTYLSLGGLFNPELANHDAVRDLIIDLRDSLATARAEVEQAYASALCEAELLSACLQERPLAATETGASKHAALVSIEQRIHKYRSALTGARKGDGNG